MTLEQAMQMRREQEQAFFELFHYEWSDCSVGDCDYKVWITGGLGKCFFHSEGLPVPSIEEYYSIDGVEENHIKFDHKTILENNKIWL